MVMLFIQNNREREGKQMKTKRILATVFMLLMLAFSAISLAACEFITTLVSGEHQHEIIMNEGESATCTQNGFKTYYSCSGCGKYFSDKMGKNEISSPETIEAVGHFFTDYKSNND